MNLTPHFTLEELTFSQYAARHGLDNKPSDEIIANLRKLAAKLEEIRALLKSPIIVSSGYRSPAVNAAVKGSKNSAHMLGLAADFTAPGYGSVIRAARKIAASGIRYDQLIYEYDAWVHVGLSEALDRQQSLSIFKGTGYLDGIVERPEVVA